MKRIALLMTAAVSSLALLTACGDTAEKATYTEEHVESSKSLVIYFDYSENIDTTGLDVDAITQASLRGGSTGKNIVPFGIHHGSQFGSMVRQMRDYEPDANVLEGFTINADTDNSSVKEQFDEYLNAL